MENKARFAGIDLCRGIAAYGVVLLHSGDKSWATVNPLSAKLSYLFDFPVPFFLATSFYLLICRRNPDLSWDYWQVRLRRIFLPYIIWTVIFLLVKTIMFSALDQDNKLKELFKDPFSIIFYGGAAIQLYFLPLLLVGTSLIIVAFYLEQLEMHIVLPFILVFLGLIFYHLLIATNNAFLLGPNIAFQSLLNKLIPNHSHINELLRLISVIAAWLVRCLPYFLIAITWRFIRFETNFRLPFSQLTAATLALLIFIIINFFGDLFLPSGFREVLLGYSLLAFGIALSHHLSNNRFIRNLGLCSFGIYLFHPLAINFIEILIKRTQPHILEQVTILSQMIFSLPSFFISWLAVHLLMKNRTIAKYLFST
ncbi:acyltransferase [Tolypothrix sp. PCC 7910]|uniref:acyltransferase family protein n=1 Tax=Tolypothrix sp. PCC 7910 TaxID=2099387 RepID=UPI0014279C76|nr:acyltransferase family protein [Tolypothrix sp. PCC 7910]QIR37802.1 acyltransferase [Tolypothrix sp. PCC 7910]